ncbi:MAG: BrnT family toxin, partial [Deltaproteobacteria bacterium]|nr:BrnT family toxin [Deltaproteobacteria bacterium]
MSYEWAAAKNRENLAKHEIDFADAVLIFDGAVVEAPDQRRDYGEERITAIGVANG